MPLHRYEKEYKYSKMYDFEELWSFHTGGAAYYLFLATIFFCLFSGMGIPLWVDLVVILLWLLMYVLLSLPNIMRLFWSRKDRKEYDYYCRDREDGKAYWQSRARNGH